MKDRKIGAAAWGFRELTLEEQLRLCRKLGFYTLELGIANVPGDVPLDAGMEQIGEIKALYKKYGLPLICGATGNDFTVADEGEREAQKEKVKQVVDICHAAGVAVVRIFAGFSRREVVAGERWERMIAALNECAAYAAVKGVVLAVETHGGVEAYGMGVRHYMSASTEPEALRQMMRELHPQIQTVYDPANLSAVGIKEPWRIYTMLKGRVAYMHLKDFVTLPDGSERPGYFGEGKVDWERCMEACSDFTGLYLIEYENPEDLEDGCRKSLDFINKLGQ